MKYVIIDAEGSPRYSGESWSTKEEAEEECRGAEENYGAIHPEWFPYRVVRVE